MIRFKPTTALYFAAIGLAFLGELLGQENLPKDYKPPYSEPPRLELKFQDDFTQDSRGDYQISGVEDAVTWEKGKLTLGDGAVLQRKLDAGLWVEMELDLEFSELTENGQTSELKVWLDFDEGTDSFVWFRQKREKGKTRSVIFFIDTNGDWNQRTKQTLVSQPWVIQEALADGKWTLGYRRGLWSIAGPQQVTRKYGFIENGSSTFKQLVVTASEATHGLETIKLKIANRVRFDPPPLVSAKLEEASTLNREFRRHYRSGQLQHAKGAAEKVRKLRKQHLGQIHPDYATILNNLAHLYSSMGAYEKVEPLYLESSAILEKVLGNKHPKYASGINNLAFYYKSLGDYERAEPLYLEAKTIRESVLGKKHVDFAASLNNLAALYKSMGVYYKAEPLLVEAIVILGNVDGKEHPYYASSLNNLALLYNSMGANEKAEPLYMKAIAIREKTKGKEHPDYAKSLNNLGLFYSSLGAYEKAEPLYQEAKAILETALGKENLDYATSLNNLGALYKSMGKYKEAELLLREAKTIRESVLGKEHPDCASTLNNLASLYHSLGADEKAEPLYLAAKAIDEIVLGEKHPDYASTLSNLASLYHSMGADEKAEPLYLKAKEILGNALGNKHPDYAVSLSNLAKLYMLLGANERAEPLLASALQITRDNIENYSIIQSEKQQRDYARSFDDLFSAFVSASLKLQLRDRLVWNQAIQWKGMSLIRQKRNTALGSLPQTRETYSELKSIRSQMSKHFQSDPTSKGWQDRKLELESKEELAEKELGRLASELALDLGVESAQEVRLPKDASVVDFRRFTYSEPDTGKPGKFRTEPHYLTLIRKSDNRVDMLDLGSAAKIERAISRWRSPIEAANRNNRFIDIVGQQAMDRAGQELRQLLWEPLEKYIGDSQLVIVSPDGALGRLPLIALPGKTPGTYLLEEKKIVYMPVPALLPQMLAKPAPRIDRSSKALLLGNIRYGSKPKQTEPDLLSFRNRQILNELQFSQLANSGTEINGIGNLFDNATRLTKTEATENAFQQKIKDHTVLHIATHGFFQSPDRFMKSLPREGQESFVMMREQAKVLTENPNLLSGLALADANAASSKQIDDAQNDGILYSAEIAMMPMEHVELAVLSACETSLGTDDNPGEGLIGIQRAFQVAGVKSTVASYWKVNDEATQMLMNKFYENLIKYSKKAKASGAAPNSTTVRIDALRDAQLWMLRKLKPEELDGLTRGVDDKVPNKDLPSKKPITKPPTKSGETTAHLRYWAAFVLSGDWR